MSSSSSSSSSSSQVPQRIILFYKYHPLTCTSSNGGDGQDNRLNVLQDYQGILRHLCQSLSLLGRILISGGHYANDSGINGTLAGNHPQVLAFTTALSRTDPSAIDSSQDREAVERFWDDCNAYFDKVGLPPLVMKPQDFKWSTVTSDPKDTADESGPSNASFLFPDLNIKIVKELISSGGRMEDIPMQETAQGYLTPKEWHAEFQRLQQHSSTSSGPNTSSDTVILDCRNVKEYDIGHFDNAIHPQMTTFAQFPTWVEGNQHLLANKRVLMYCTGGIRCEKASAFVRKHVDSVKEVRHLQGGIHKYLEEFGGNDAARTNETKSQDESGEAAFWKGKNFVFDGRGAASAEETRTGGAVPISTDQSGEAKGGALGLSSTSSDSNQKPQSIVGKCVYCKNAHDEFHPGCVCTVCREPTLVCATCQKRRLTEDAAGKSREYHCTSHFHLRDCYFSNLDCYTYDELQQQRKLLQSHYDEIAVGRKFKQKRRTLARQLERILHRLQELEDDGHHITTDQAPPLTNDVAVKCRSCGETGCSGRCWGFYSLKRKEILERNMNERSVKSEEMSRSETQKVSSLLGNGKTSLELEHKNSKRAHFVKELQALKLSLPPESHRDATTGVRVPPVVTRTVGCHAKGKWCGRPIVQVMQEQFSELSSPAKMQQIIELGLLRLNGKKVGLLESSQIRLKSSDMISRIVHWHEPPVIVPSRIQVKKISLPRIVSSENESSSPETFVYVCDKPSSVPVHPSGPYLSNTLTMMVEAQENLAPSSLIPLHRTDRATSGLTLLSTDPSVSRTFHSSLASGNIRKLYIAKVSGRFISSEVDEMSLPKQEIGSYAFNRETGIVDVDAPVETINPSDGIRAVSVSGKPSRSRFRLMNYSDSDDTSLVACSPITGRNHQLRVHLQWLGFPIIGDVQYGGHILENDYDKVRETSLSMMEKAIVESVECERLPELSKQDVEAAKQGCPCCTYGVVDSFTDAQLLSGGHSILLHALRYSITILPRRKRKSTEVQDPVGTLELSVDLPTWANTLPSASIDWLS